ncbi:unnamed protein product [Adineta steineri]|uniref:Uncharacterized protein n=1 Tax=Adineta steineri TaxID=433720 RepID=A0A818PVQ8_9BILA|nr:unnamed protein product [Adineta steineri]CAF0940614.1 unnamed protein product [Adineta steineri]CAF3631460.1 unnamed protein product [Adineta steineri]
MQRMIDNIDRSNSSTQHNSRGIVQAQHGSSGTIQAQENSYDAGQTKRRKTQNSYRNEHENVNNDTIDQGTYTTGKFAIVFHKRKENDYLRLKRVKMGADDSESLKIITRGAFGEDSD